MLTIKNKALKHVLELLVRNASLNNCLREPISQDKQFNTYCHNRQRGMIPHLGIPFYKYPSHPLKEDLRKTSCLYLSHTQFKSHLQTVQDFSKLQILRAYCAIVLYYSKVP